MKNGVMHEEWLCWSLNGAEQRPLVCSGNHPEELLRGVLFTRGLIVSPAAEFTVRQNGQCWEVTGTVSAVPGAIRPLGPAAGPAYETAALADSVLNTAYSRFGVHRAAVLGSGGSAYVREDIGRHNACDMAIAAAYLAGEDPGSCALALSGRVTTEILYKAVRAGIPAVYTTKYPSDLASEEAGRLGVTVYSVPRRPKAGRSCETPGKPVPAVAFSAWSGTGKTTLLVRVIGEMKRRGLRVAVLKHDAHDFEIDREGKDSWRFAQAGADMVAISSPAKTAAVFRRSFTAEELIGRVRDADLILVEGYNNAGLPRIGVSRAATGKGFREDPSRCIALVTDEPVPDAAAPVFGLDDIEPLCDFILNFTGLSGQTEAGR